MKNGAKLGLGLGAAALLLLAGGSGGGGQGAGAPPQRTPTVPPAKPATPKGEERDDDQGRTWGTFYVNRDKTKHHEMRVFSVASSPSNAKIGSGFVIVDTYETIVGDSGWEWQGQSCRGHRWELKFANGHLVTYRGLGPLPCLSVRPLHEVYARSLRWIQIGSNIYLVLDTQSGINMLSPDKMTKTEQHKPGKYGGTGDFDADASKHFEVDKPQWDNDFVNSGYVTLDASWIFNPA